LTPLTTTFWLAKTKKTKAWIEPSVDGKRVRFDVVVNGSGEPPPGTVIRSGATCVGCGSPIEFAYIRDAGMRGELGQQLMAVVAKGATGREYHCPTRADMDSAALDRVDPFEAPLPEKALGFRVQAYGMKDFKDLYTARQLKAVTVFSDVVQEVCEQIEKDASVAGMESSGRLDACVGRS
jgi:putative DNA methylase